MKRLSLACFFLLSLFASAQTLYFPPSSGNAWESITPASLGWNEANIPDLYNYLETNNSKAFIVLKGGKIVMEKYFGTFTQDSVWYWASAGKTLTGFTIGIAQQEGYLSIKDTTSKYLGKGWTGCPQDKEDMITIRNQISMTTGLDDGVADNHCTLDSYLVYKADAGTRWAYHNAPYTLLDKVIEAATGKTLNVYITSKIKTPTGMTGLFVTLDYDHVFYSTARSMARFGLLLLNKGTWDNTPILTDTAYFRQMTNSSQSINPSYGYLTWLNGKNPFMLPQSQIRFPSTICPNAPAEMFAAIGKNNQLINVVPSQNLVLIRMGNSNSNNEVSMLFNDTIWQKLNKVIGSSTNAIKPISTSNKLQITQKGGKSIDVLLPNEHFELNLLDINGKSFYQKKNIDTKAVLEINAFPNGIYLLRVATKTEVITKKILITHY